MYCGVFLKQLSDWRKNRWNKSKKSSSFEKPSGERIVRTKGRNKTASRQPRRTEKELKRMNQSSDQAWRMPKSVKKLVTFFSV
jgi:hypothetical protein